MMDWDIIILCAWLGSWLFWYIFGYSLGRRELSLAERGIIEDTDLTIEDILDIIKKLREREE